MTSLLATKVATIVDSLVIGQRVCGISQLGNPYLGILHCVMYILLS